MFDARQDDLWRCGDFCHDHEVPQSASVLPVSVKLSFLQFCFSGGRRVDATTPCGYFRDLQECHTKRFTSLGSPCMCPAYAAYDRGAAALCAFKHAHETSCSFTALEQQRVWLRFGTGNNALVRQASSR